MKAVTMYIKPFMQITYRQTILMTKKDLILQLHAIQAIQFGEFLLKSGQISPLYINLRKIISFPEILRSAAQLIWDIAKAFPADFICGVPYTALPIATCIALQEDLAMVMRRKEKKDYGTKQMVEGVYQAGQTCLIIEDVITSGASIRETAQALEESGLQVIASVALIDREQGGLQNLSTHFPCKAVLTLTEVLTTLKTSNKLSPTEISIVNSLLATRHAS